METSKQARSVKESRSSLLSGFIFGILFGFLLQKGGATKYDVIIGQLLFKDFTVVKIMLSAVVTGMLGIHIMKSMNLITLSIKRGSVGMNVFGGLIFGIGFALLGYCPGTIAGAIGNGYLDALTGGLIGILIGAGLFASLYPKLNKGILKIGDLGDLTLPRLFKVNDWFIVIPVTLMILMLLYWIEAVGF